MLLLFFSPCFVFCRAFSLQPQHLLFLVSKKRATKAKGKSDVDPDTIMHTTEHIQSEQNMNYVLIKIDVDLRFGQIRGIDAQHVRDLSQSMLANRPAYVNPTVWPDQGVFLNLALMPPVGMFSAWVKK